MIKSEIVADSISLDDLRITTFKVEFPHIILPQVLTHRKFSRSTSSSRAIPVETLIQRVLDNPFIPIFSKNKSGMQGELSFTEEELTLLKNQWHNDLHQIINKARRYIRLNVHKQTANRLLEPFSHVSMVITATSFNNFFNLRISDHAQYEIRELAERMQQGICNSIPETLLDNEYHLPFISQEEFINYDIEKLIKASVARCARTSYLNHDNTHPDIEQDVKLHDRLLKDEHMSPFEMVASPNSGIHANLDGWKSYRSVLEDKRELGE